MESSSLRFCKTDSQRSSVSSCGRAFVQTRNKRSKAFAVAKLLAELVRGVLAENSADAHAIKHAVGRIILLDKDRRVGGVEAVAETVGVGAGGERTDLHSEKNAGGVRAPQNIP